jgi:hypothetical protein
MILVKKANEVMIDPTSDEESSSDELPETTIANLNKNSQELSTSPSTQQVSEEVKKTIRQKFLEKREAKRKIKEEKRRIEEER